MAARDIWTTHRVVNEAVAEVERLLLLCRGQGYVLPDGNRFEAGEVQAEALKRAREIQSANGKPGAGSDQAILTLLRRLYEEMVPSCLLDEKGKPRAGNAQQSRGFVGPLMNPESEGFQGVFDEIVEPLPEWVAIWKEDQGKAAAASAAWLASEEGQMLLRKARRGRPPGWISAVERGQPWQEKFIRDQDRKRKECEGVAGIFEQMRELGLLPLMAPPIKSRLADASGALSDWDYLAVRLAVGHLLSWESWNHRARQEYEVIRRRTEMQRSVVDAFGAVVAAIRAYEGQRHEELKTITEATDDRPFRIGPRAIRAWDRIRERWFASGVRTALDRKRVLGELQTELRGRLGDPHLFGWLAEDAQERVWRDTDPLPEVARLNAIERLLDRKKNQAACTVADARLHPRWVQYGAKGDGNLKNYELRLTEDRRHVEVTLPCLHTDGNGLREITHRLRVAPSAQLDTPQFGGENKRPTVAFGPPNDRLKATLGSADMLLHRRLIENRRRTRLGEGDVGPVWLKLALDVESQAPPTWLDDKGKMKEPAEKYHFQTALGEKTKNADQIRPGFRVLSVDLGVRTFAACSVFELVDTHPTAGLFFPIEEPAGLWAKHERSFLLALPGETPNKEHLEARKSTRDEWWSLWSGVTRLSVLLRLSIEGDPAVRRSIVESWLAQRAEQQAGYPPQLLDERQLKELHAKCDSAPEEWAALVGDLHRACEGKLGAAIGQWRAQTRTRSARPYQGGKSVWAIEYIGDVRRLLQRWSRHARRQGQIRRADREKGGIFAARLLAHLNGLKADRVKTGADLIVQAARGYRQAPRGGWVRDYEPCRLILFENLARYRFRVDRPRFENSQLMKWAHREIVNQTAMQAEVYGIAIADTSAGFSSRFHARTGAPGVRVRTLTTEDLAAPFMRERIERELEGLGVSIDALQPGDRIPWPGGETFVTLRPPDVREGDGILELHADLNAAQNLQRRFWTRHAEAYRLTAVEVGASSGELAGYYPSPLGKRVLGALKRSLGGSGTCRLVPAEDGEGYLLEAVAPKLWSRVTSSTTTADEEEMSDADAEIDEALGDLARTGERETFFRDPSGLVLRADRWYPQKVFWGCVRQRIGKALLSRTTESIF